MNVIKPDWPAPKNIVAFTTTRQDGHSQLPYDAFNLAMHVGDDHDAVEKNRKILLTTFNLPYEPAWLTQTHSTMVVENNSNFSLCEGDASFTREKNKVCAVLTADCLPLLVCNRAGDEVAAIHAGWRGLANGVIEATLKKLQSKSSDLLVWLGPAIGPAVYEVGHDVHEIFLRHNKTAEKGFEKISEDKWLMNTYALACQRLTALGVNAIFGGDHCTYTERELFYSFRRDNVTGRMASLIYFNH
jgi:YfiH family protein